MLDAFNNYNFLNTFIYFLLIIKRKDINIMIEGIFTKEEEIAMFLRDALTELDSIEESISYLRRMLDRIAEQENITLRK